MAPKETRKLISVDELLQSIDNVERCFTDKSSDYKTGYLSAMAAVKGMINFMAKEWLQNESEA